MTRQREEHDRAALARFQELLELPFDRPLTRLILAADSADSKDRLDRRELTISADLGKRFRGNVETALRAVVQEGQGAADVCSHYVETTLMPGQVEYIDLEAPDASDLLPRVAPWRILGEVNGFDDRDDAFVKRLRYYAIVVETEDRRRAVGFRAFSPKQELARSRFFGVVGRHGVYDEVDSRIFLFDDYVDCVLYRSHLFILRKTFFQQIFRYFEVLDRRAERALTTLPEVAPIANFDAFRKDAIGQAKRVKLASISERAYVREKTPIPIERWKEVIAEFQLAVGVGTDAAGNVQLLYDAKRPWELFRLLDDDYLVSDLTERGYEATGKRPHALRRGKARTRPPGSPSELSALAAAGEEAPQKRTA